MISLLKSSNFQQLADCLICTYFTSQMCIFVFKYSSILLKVSYFFLYFPLFWQKLNSSIFLEAAHDSCYSVVAPIFFLPI